ncbi:MAG: CopG family transcriptional regulator [Nitrososphaerota archaeon]|nr:CopG family transcriptional regulator [Nitrososphaerota archaeon]
MNAGEKEVLHISRELYKEILKRLEASKGEFKTADEYVEFVLRELLASESNTSLTKEEEDQIKERLKSLGYV